MHWFNRHSDANSIRFRAMLESGELVDEVADVVQTQVIVKKARASIRTRNTVPLYHQTQEDQTPVWQENLLVETGLSPPPDMDSRYILVDSLDLWKGIKTGTVENELESMLKNNIVAIAANVVAGIAFLAMIWLASVSGAPVQAAVEEVNQENGHGFVGTMAPESGEEEGGAAPGAGSAAGGEPSQEPLVPAAGADPGPDASGQPASSP